MSSLSLLLMGCDRSNGRQDVSGAVLVDGKPLAVGAIYFRSVGGQDSNAGGPVKDGQFVIPATHGILPGKYVVAVQAVRPTGRIVHDPKMGDREEMTPVEFRKSDSVSATVTAGGNNHFEFNLNSR